MKRFLISLLLPVVISVCAEEPKPIQPTNPTSLPASPATVAPTTPPAKTTATGIAAPPRPISLPLNLPKPPNPDWISLVERLRIQPRAGEINNGTIQTLLSNIFSANPDLNSKSAELAEGYEKALLEKGAKWESELKELRAQFDAKAIALLPEDKREAAQKFLDASRASWAESAARDTKLRAAFLERMRAGARFQPSGVGAAGTPAGDPNAWMRDERMKAMKQDEDCVRTLRTLLAADDAARFDRFNRARPLPQIPTTQRPAVPPTPTTPAPQHPASSASPSNPPAPPSVGATPTTPADSKTDKK